MGGAAQETLTSKYSSAHSRINLTRRRIDPVAADFTYIRWLGDRHGIEELTKTWDKVIVDRSRELIDWAEICQEFRKRGVDVFGYVNNHYAGHSPETLRSLLDLIDPALRRHRPKPRTLFEM